MSEEVVRRFDLCELERVRDELTKRRSLRGAVAQATALKGSSDESTGSSDSTSLETKQLGVPSVMSKPSVRREGVS